MRAAGVNVKLINIVVMIAVTFLNAFIWNHSCCRFSIYPIMTSNSIYHPKYSPCLAQFTCKIDRLVGKKGILIERDPPRDVHGFLLVSEGKIIFQSMSHS